MRTAGAGREIWPHQTVIPERLLASCHYRFASLNALREQATHSSGSVARMAWDPTHRSDVASAARDGPVDMCSASSHSTPASGFSGANGFDHDQASHRKEHDK